MSPMIKYNDYLWVEKEKTYQKGDIVIYNHPRMGLICHRLVWTDGEFFRSKGDYNRRFDDGLFSVSIIEGKVRMILSHGVWEGIERKHKDETRRK